MTSPRSILIAGAGLAGARCAETLRAEGYDGELVLVGEEPFAPYERPALSKEFLAGDSPPRALAAARLVLGRAADRARPRPARRHGRPRASPHHQRRARHALGRARRSRPVRVRGASRSTALASTCCARSPTPSRSAATPPRRAARDRRRRIRRRGGRVDGARLGVDVTMLDAGRRRSSARSGRSGRQARRALPRPRRRPPHQNGRGRVPGLIRQDVCAGSSPTTAVSASRRRPRRGRRRGGEGSPPSSRRRSMCAATPRSARDTGPARPRAGRAQPAHPRPGPATGAPSFFWSDQFGLRLQLVGDTTHADEIELEGSHESFIARYRARGGRLVAALASNQPAAMGGLRLEVAAAA